MSKTIRTYKWLKVVLAIVVLVGVLLCAFPALQIKAEEGDITVTLDGNGETFKVYDRSTDKTVESKTDTQTIYSGITVDYFDRDNYKGDKYVKDWYYDAGLTKLANGSDHLTSDTTLFASWADKIHIRLDPNGGKYRSDETQNFVPEPQDFYYLPGEYYVGGLRYALHPLYASNVKAPEGSNLVFDGWSKDKNGNETLKYGGTNFLPTEDLVLYAKWVKPAERKDYHTVTFLSNGYKDTAGYFDENGIYSVTTRNGDGVYTPWLSTEDNGHAPVGWYTDKACTKLYPLSFNDYDEEYLRQNEDITLYAGPSTYKKITANATLGDYTVSMQGDTSKTMDFYVNNGQSFENALRDAHMPDKRPDGKVFSGWYYDSAFTKPVDLKDQVNRDVTVYARWSDPVTITLKSKHCYFENYSDTMEIQVASDAPLTSYFTFIGYNTYLRNDQKRLSVPLNNDIAVYSDSNQTKLVDTEKVIPKNGDIYYVDIPENVHSIILHFGEGGATGLWSLRSDIILNSKEGLEIKSIFDYLVENNYIVCTPGETFLEGWYTDPDFTNRFNDKNCIIKSDLELYAKYTSEIPEDVKPAPKPSVLNGLVKGPDGKWAMYKNGKVDTTATGIYQNEYGWWRVENGYVNFKAQGIYQNDYGWWKTTDGKVTFKETGVFQNENGWWRVKDSKVDFKANGIYQNKHGWWKTTNGKVTFKETGVFQNENGWWRVKDSKVDFKANGIYQNQYGWWKTTDGKVTFKENGIFQNENGWWVVKDSKVDFNDDGFYKHGKEIWKFSNGGIDFKENGTFIDDSGDQVYVVKGSKVDTKATGLYEYDGNLLKFTNGVCNFKENGLYKNKKGTWYYENSKVLSDFTGYISYKDDTLHLVNGKVVNP